MSSPWSHSTGAGTGKISPQLGQRTRLPTNSIDNSYSWPQPQVNRSISAPSPISPVDSCSGSGSPRSRRCNSCCARRTISVLVFAKRRNWSGSW